MMCYYGMFLTRVLRYAKNLCTFENHGLHINVVPRHNNNKGYQPAYPEKYIHTTLAH